MKEDSCKMNIKNLNQGKDASKKTGGCLRL